MLVPSENVLKHTRIRDQITQANTQTQMHINIAWREMLISTLTLQICILPSLRNVALIHRPSMHTLQINKNGGQQLLPRLVPLAML